MKRYLIISFLLFAFLSVSAQNDTIVKKFGDVKPEDFVPTELEKMGGYKAVILLNQRSVYFDVFHSQLPTHPSTSAIYWDLRFVNTYHIRYKALEDNFLDENKFVIPFSGRYEYEFLPKVRAEIFSCVNNKVVSKKIKFKNTKIINRDSILSRMEIIFPDIKRGDIVDIEYTVASFDYLNPAKWDFHHEYPCLVSQVVTVFPDNISYDVIITGENIPVNKIVKPHTIIYSVDRTYYYTYMAKTTEQLSYRLPGEKTFCTAYNTLPVDTMYNFMPQKNYNDAQLYLRPKKFTDEYTAGMDGWSRLISMLRKYADPDCRYKSQYEVRSMPTVDSYVTFESGNWKRFNKRQRQSPVFWKPILKSFLLPDKLANLYDDFDGLDSLTMLKQIYGFVTSNVKWDSTFANYIAHYPEDVLQKGSGSSAEINGTFVSLLRRAGFNALPVFSATRDFGMVDSTYANTLQFNNILAYVTFTQNDSLNSFLIDATCPERNFDVLNAQNINNMYLVMDLDKSTHSFLVYPPSSNNVRIVSAELKNNDWVISEKSTGLFAVENSDYLKSHNPEQYVKSRFDFNNSEIRHLNSNNENGVFEFSAHISHTNADAISIMRNLIGENPFPELVRTVPVDFIYPRKYSFVIYSNDLLSFPEQSFNSCNNKLSAHIYVDNSNSSSALHLDINITETMFSVAEYDYLRKFFDDIYIFLGN
ncbi:MAG: transglutaminase domain-containing protein [Bacteroidales bacterium]|nr:transglutaminase domain-containing protein [Bacteroidales bacterium]